MFFTILSLLVLLQEKSDDQPIINVNVPQPTPTAIPPPVYTAMPPPGAQPYYPQPVYNQQGQLVYPQYPPPGVPPMNQPVPQAQPVVMQSTIQPVVAQSMLAQPPVQSALPGWDVVATDEIPATADLIKLNEN